MTETARPNGDPHRNEPDDPGSLGVIEDPAESAAPSPHLRLVTPPENRDWNLSEETIETGRRGVAMSRAELAAAEERSRQQESQSPPTQEPEEQLDPERPF